jgi:Fe-S cluster biogenesis protein NfuA
MDDTLAKIEHALDTVRSYLMADGGDVRVVSLSEDLDLKLELTGACGICPMSTMTFKAGIEEAIRKHVPQIKNISAVNLTPVL